MVPMYHYVTFSLILVMIIGGIILAFCDCSNNVWHGILFAISGLALLLTAFYARGFATKAQDRAIRAEENFRHFVMTGKPFDPALKMRQIIGLRFASDEELIGLVERALKEDLSEKEIKKSIKNWRGDYFRV